MRGWKLFTMFLFIVSSLKLSAHHKHNDLSKKQCDSLLTVYNKNKTFDSSMLVPTLLALQYYPELRETQIEFKYKNIPTLMAARPKIFSIFGKKKNRRYLIIISTNPHNNSKQLFQNMSLSSKTGILGHEFAHILDYEKESCFGIIKYGIKYLYNKKEIERHTDKIAIQRGLGIDMLNYNQHLKKSKLLSKEYLLRKKKYYLSVSEIEGMLAKTF